MFYTRFLFKNERIAHSLFFGEQCEQIAQVAHQKLAVWVNCSGRSPKISDHEQISQVAHQKWAHRSYFWAKRSFAHFFAKNKWFAQKTDEQIPTPVKILLMHSSSL